jgi:hypothetical protein
LPFTFYQAAEPHRGTRRQVHSSVW